MSRPAVGADAAPREPSRAQEDPRDQIPARTAAVRAAVVAGLPLTSLLTTGCSAHRVAVTSEERTFTVEADELVVDSGTVDATVLTPAAVRTQPATARWNCTPRTPRRCRRR
ncbi:hypothetical protein [Streptomyces spiramenti]|uniref:Uncharacterized protein n=1 Tax=Streptomyces spiramenti TaxID=2720606 RepID=A0ABX1AQW1_9ACTN|nr:hypothetical protein [Streptomyces spiramenti]NJP68111.1 hypothetical protein [Streptomyces spiramenti]